MVVHPAPLKLKTQVEEIGRGREVRGFWAIFGSQLEAKLLGIG